MDGLGMFHPLTKKGAKQLGEALWPVPFCPNGALLRVHASAGEVSSLTTSFGILGILQG